MSLALKYRPTRFADLIAQESVTKTLSLALKGGHTAHAYLFSGLRGSGKTSSARIFARALQCEKTNIDDPCNECSSCLESLAGKHMDIIEMDAASSRKIDDIRDLIEQTRYAPAIGRYKIFIIDEVHMLTKEAFNALLKTLEEPPSYIKFILATTDPLKLPATILSRTQHFRFKKIPQKFIIKHLENILQKEQIEYDMPSIEIIARSGNGSLRDTLTLTDQAIAYCNKKLESSKITQMLGVIDPMILRDFFSAIKVENKDKINELLELFEGYESEMLLDEMMLYLKDSIKAQANLSLLTLDRYLRIIADSKHLLSLNCDGGFVMLLTTLKMQEAQKFENLETEISLLESSLAPLQTQANSISHNKIDPTPQITQPQITQTSKLQELFSQLLAKVYDRNLELGQAFEASITPISFENSILTWHSKADKTQKALLSTHFGIIKHLVAEVFGPSTKITQGVKSTQDEPTQPTQPTQNQNLSDKDLAQDAAKVFYEQNQELVDALTRHIPITDIRRL